MNDDENGRFSVHASLPSPEVDPLVAKLFNLNFHPLEIVDRPTSSSELKLFRFDKMEVDCFQILLIGVIFYL